MTKFEAQRVLDHAYDSFEDGLRANGPYTSIAQEVDATLSKLPGMGTDREQFRFDVTAEFLRLQISWARRRNQDPRIAELKHQFSGHRSIIDSAVSSSALIPTASGQNLVTELLAPPEIALKAEQRVGVYELIEHLGVGGMGTVWKARQLEPVQREVALKFMRHYAPSRELFSRFRNEQQALAVLDHSNIAKIFDSGKTPDDHFYFAMELVSGESITRFADRENLASRQRAELLLPVCQAIQHAHQKGIIHRDLKPSNVLVHLEEGAPVPKIIDFGLAKAMGMPLTNESLHTVQGQILGTPEYMSPEQTRLGQIDIDTRTDIYALGAILFELLTGRPPFVTARLRSMPMEDALDTIREEEVPLPSTLARDSKSVRGELDWIVGKCLEKDRTRRYDSVASLISDLEGFLAGEPIEAAPPSQMYRLRKFVAKNRGWMTAVVALFLVLLAGLVGTGWALRWALQERTVAQEAEKRVSDQADELRETLSRAVKSETLANNRASDLQQVTDFQGQQLLQIDPSTIGQRIRDTLVDQRRDLLNKQKKLPEQIDAELASFADQIAFVNFADVGSATLRVDFFERLWGEIDRAFDNRVDIRVGLLESLADSAHELGSVDVAHRLQQVVVELHKTLSGTKGEATLASQAKLGLYLHELSRYEDADRVLGPNVELCREVLDRAHLTTIDSLLNHAKNLQRLGNFDGSESHVREARSLSIDTHGQDSKVAIRTSHLLGQILSEKREFDEAERLLKENLDTCRRTCKPNDQDLISAIGEFGTLMERMRRWQEAEPLLRECLNLCEEHRGKYHPETLKAINNLGSFLTMWKNQRDALVVLEDSLERQRRVLGEFHQQTLVAEQSIAVPHFFMKEYDKAIAIFEDVLPRLVVVAGETSEATVLVRANLGINYRQVGKLDEALRYLEEAYSQRLQSYDLAFIPKELFETCMRAKKLDRAKEIALAELETINKRSPDPTPERLLALWPIGNWLRRVESWVEAEATLRECLSMREKLEAGDWKLYDNQSVLGEVLMKQGKTVEANTLLHEGYEGLAKSAESIPKSWRRDHIPNALRRLIDFHRNANQPELVAQYEEQLRVYEAALAK